MKPVPGLSKGELSLDINKIVVDLQLNRHIRKDVFLQYMNSQDDFFALHYYGNLEERTLFDYLNNVRKHKTLMLLLPEVLRYSSEKTISARVVKRLLRLPKRMRRTCIHSLAHCELSFFQHCVLLSLSPEMESYTFILECMIKDSTYSLNDVQLLVEYACEISKSVIDSLISQFTIEKAQQHTEEKILWLKSYVDSDTLR